MASSTPLEIGLYPDGFAVEVWRGAHSGRLVVKVSGPPRTAQSGQIEYMRADSEQEAWARAWTMIDGWLDKPAARA